MKTSANIYTVKVEQIIKKTYFIKAETEDEALKIVEEIWDETNVNEVDGWDHPEIKVTYENNNPSQSDLQSVNNQ